MNKELGFKLILIRLAKLGYLADIESFYIGDYVDDVGDIMYDYGITHTELENIFIHKFNHNLKKYIIEEYNNEKLEEE